MRRLRLVVLPAVLVLIVAACSSKSGGGGGCSFGGELGPGAPFLLPTIGWFIARRRRTAGQQAQRIGRGLHLCARRWCLEADQLPQGRKRRRGRFLRRVLFTWPGI